jgi:hypothetical protein
MLLETLTLAKHLSLFFNKLPKSLIIRHPDIAPAVMATAFKFLEPMTVPTPQRLALRLSEKIPE